MSRTGVLGGTFDPPHLAHLVLAAAARKALNLDRVLFVPAGNPWRKANREVTAAAVRLDLVRAAVAPLAWVEVSTIEVDRDGPSYAAETMEMLAADGGEWWFILGSDALADLPHWHEPERLIAAARLAVAVRPPATLRIDEPTLAALPGLAARVDAVPMPALEVSSTDLRARVRAGRTTEVLISDAVRTRIEVHGLYR